VGDIALRSPKLRRGSYGFTRALTRFRPGAVTRGVSGPESGGSFISPRVVWQLSGRIRSSMFRVIVSPCLRPTRRDPQQSCEVGSVCGACMLVRREAADQVRLLDTDFDPLYSEEVEWCHCIRQAG
jgi:GT2 family glycosyltransferase